MDTIVGYVTYVFDDSTVKIHITNQCPENENHYFTEEKLKISSLDGIRETENGFGVKISLIYKLLCKKISVKVLRRGQAGLIGKVEVLPEYVA